MIDLVYFLFLFHFPLFFIVNQRQRRQKCDTSHKSHAHVTQWNNIKGSREDDVIQHS